MNIQETAKRLGVRPAKLKEWREAGCPYEIVNRAIHFDPEELELWLLTTGRASRRGTETTFDKGAAELREAQLKVEERELKVRKARGELMPVEQALAITDYLVSNAAAHLNELPDAVANALNLSGPEYVAAKEAAERVVATCRRDLRSIATEILSGLDSRNTSTNGAKAGRTRGKRKSSKR